MTVRIRIQSEATPILRQMAKEAGVQVHDMAEIAVYNLIALYLKEHAQPQPFDDAGPITVGSHDGMVPAE